MERESDFSIDEMQLEREWMKQSSLVRNYTMHQAECQRAYDEAKNAFELVKAECDMMLRKNPAKYGLSKVTEKAIENKLPTLAKYQETQQAVVDARYDLDIAKSAVQTLEHKKRSLTSLVELWLAEYYSEPVSGKVKRSKEREGDDAVDFRKRRKRRRDREANQDED